MKKIPRMIQRHDQHDQSTQDIYRFNPVFLYRKCYSCQFVLEFLVK